MTAVLLRWEGDEFKPVNHAVQRTCDKQYVVGQIYRMDEVSERSEESHRQEFAYIDEAFLTMPEHLSDQFSSATALRKKALIDCGFYHETIIDAGTPQAALEVSAFIRKRDEFAYVVVRDHIVVMREAKSQKKRGPDRMNKAEFQKSKQAILEYIAALLDVTPEALLANAKEAE